MGWRGVRGLGVGGDVMTNLFMTCLGRNDALDAVTHLLMS